MLRAMFFLSSLALAAAVRPVHAQDLTDLPTGKLTASIACHRCLFQQPAANPLLVGAQQMGHLVRDFECDLHCR